MHNCKLNNTGSQCSNFEGTYSSLVYTYCQRHRFVLFKNGFNAVLWCCLQTMIKRLKVSLKKAVRVNETSVSPYLSISLPSATVVAERLCFHKRLSAHRGEVYTPWADTPFPRQIPPPTRQTPPPWPDTTPNHETATSADGTHPTGMHSCSICSFPPDHSLQTMTWCTQKYRNDSRNLEATDIFILDKDWYLP